MRHTHKRRRDFWKEWAESIAGDDLPPDPRAWRAYFAEHMGMPPGEHWLFRARRFKPWHMGDIMYNPFVSAWLSKSGGLLPLYTLHLLERSPRYGHEIMTMLEERTDAQGLANPAALYPLLSEMESCGFVESEWDDDVKRTRRRYTITEAGVEELARLKAIMRPKLREAIEVLKDMLDDLESDPDEEK